MDPKLGWLQPEQFGRAAELWLRVWETVQVGAQDNNGKMGGPNTQSAGYFHPQQTQNGSSNTSPDASMNGTNVNGNQNHRSTPTGNGPTSGPPKLPRMDNRARIYGLGLHNNKVNITHQQGCPWQWLNRDRPYSRGVMGYVSAEEKSRIN